MPRPSLGIDGSDVAAAVMDGVGVLEGAEFVYATDRLGAIHGCSMGEALIGRDWAELYTDTTTAAGLLTRAREMGAWHGAAFARRIDDDTTVPVELSLRTTGQGVLCAVRDSPAADESTANLPDGPPSRTVSERIRKDAQSVRQLLDELDTLNRINSLLLEILGELFESTSLRAGEMERAVCERLVGSDLYRFAWIGAPEPGGDRIVPHVSAGAGAGAEEGEPVGITDRRVDTGKGPGGRAFTTGEIQVSQDVRTDPAFAPWRETALERDARSAVAVPLRHDDTVYGVLALFVTGPRGFTPREQQHLEILGEAVGFAIDAAKTRKLLYAEAVSELTFELSAVETALFRVSDVLDCALALDSYVESDVGDWLLYLTVTDSDAERVVAAVADDDRVEAARVVRDGDAQSVGLVAESPVLDTVAAVGGTVTAAEVEAGRGQIVVEVPQSTDARSVVERVQSAYPDASVTTCTDHERPAADPTASTDHHGPDLTDRQRQVLEAAFHGGYFEWPRESTAEDVAGLLGIAAPTLHAHLRKAERELVSEFLQRDR
jgi:predicted DNA binding protein